MIAADLLIEAARLVVTCAGPAPRSGAGQAAAGAIPHASIAGWQGRIVAVGPAADVAAAVRLVDGAQTIDARGRTVVPGFVDPHTHMVYAGDRRDELARRLAGATYADIAAGGGGIVRTVAATRNASVDELAAAARPRLAEALAQGTTTCEVKSGYGLETEAELRMLRAVRVLATSQPVELSPTFMGAHEVPVEYRSRRDEYLRLVVDQMLPAVAAEGLAEWNDVFCEDGVFTPGEARRVLETGRRHGLSPRIHADELGASGGSRVAAEVGAISADHLIYTGEAEADAMARAGVIATLLPAAAFYLKLGRYAPARMFVERGVPVALATDMNPGGGLTPSMPVAIALACFAMDLTLEEALVAATANAAAALGRQDRVGSLEAGKQFDAVILDGPLTDLLRLGAPVIRLVIKRGAVVAGTAA